MSKKIALFLFTFLLMASPAMASKLPDDLWNYIKTEIPGSSQRFDSVIVLPDKNLYIPLYPAQKSDHQAIQVEYTYPKSGSLKSLPEVVIFNDNFVLLKAFKDKKGRFSVTANENLPAKVRLGVMPQDMLVPVGLVIPESLKLVMGNLDIPQPGDDTVLSGEVDLVDKKIDKKAQKFTPLVELSGKKYFVSTNSSKFVYVYDSASKEPLYELKLNSLPSKILASNNTKFALALYFSDKTLEVLDLDSERVVERITLEGTPKDAEIDTVNDLVYVTSAEANKIYAIDLKSAKLVKEITLEQAPSKIGISKSGKVLSFIDYKTNDLYVMRLEGDEYVARYLDKTSNLSKILVDDANVYTISRSSNQLNIYDIESAKLSQEQKTSTKPIDALIEDGKIYILCAKDGIVDVYGLSERKMLKTSRLDSSAFYSKITKIPGQKNALVTGVGGNGFLLFDLENAVVTKKQPFEHDVMNLILIDK